MTDIEIPLSIRINSAKAWKPDPDRTMDEVLTGTVVAVTPRTTEYGTYPVVVLDLGDGGPFAAFHAFHDIALDQLKTVRPTAGERLTIVAHPKAESGKRKDANGDPVVYNPYSIFNPDNADEAVPEFDFDDPDF